MPKAINHDCGRGPQTASRSTNRITSTATPDWDDKILPWPCNIVRSTPVCFEAVLVRWRISPRRLIAKDAFFGPPPTGDHERAASIEWF